MGPLTQAPVPPGESFDYDFVAPNPDTYWYRSHDRGWEQVERGMEGPLIVEDREPWQGEPGTPAREMTLVLVHEPGDVLRPCTRGLHSEKLPTSCQRHCRQVAQQLNAV